MSRALPSGRRIRRSVTIPRAPVLVVGFLAATFIVTSTMNMTDPLAPTLPAVLAGGVFFLVLLSGNGAWMVHATLIVLFTTSVPEIPRGIRLGGVFVYFYELLILGAFLYAAFRARKSSKQVLRMKALWSVRATVLFGVVVLAGVGLAVVRGYPFWDIQYDVKSIVELIMVIFVAAIVVALDDWQRYMRTITAILIFSAALTVYASVTGFVLWGRTETAELYAVGGHALAGGSTAVRYLTQTTPLALAAASGCVAMLLLGRARFLETLPILIPSVLITVLSFSRNTLLALAGTLVFVLLIAIASRQFIRLIVRLALAPVVAAIVALGMVSLGGALGATQWIDTQATGYANRVIAGLEQSNERADTSASYREQENDYIQQAGAEHPVLGGGFGTHYKPPSGKRDTFPAFEGTMYTHNAYNWLYVKVGLVGLVVFALLIASCVGPALLRNRSNELLQTSAAILVGLAVAITVTPMPIEQPGSALLGIVIGTCIGARAVVDKWQGAEIHIRGEQRLPVRSACSED